MGQYVAGGAYYGAFITVDPVTGVPAAPDAPPTITATRNGVDDAAFTITPSALATGRYSVSGTVPAYSVNDRVIVTASYAVGGRARMQVVDSFQVVAAKPSVALAALDVNGNIPAKVNEIANDAITAASIKDDAVEEIAAGVEAAILAEDDGRAVQQALVDKIAAADLQLGDITVQGIAQAVWAVATDDAAVEGSMGELVQVVKANQVSILAGLNSLADYMVDVNTTVSVGNTAKSFTLSSGPTTAGAFLWQLCTVKQTSSGTEASRSIVGYTSGRVVTLDNDLPFTPIAGDTVRILALGRSQVNVGSWAGTAVDTLQEEIETAMTAFGVSTLDAQGVRDAAKLAPSAGDPAEDSLEKKLELVKAKTDKIATNNADSPATKTMQTTVSTNLNTSVSSRLATTSYVAPPTDYQKANVAVVLPTTPPTGYGGGTVNFVVSPVSVSVSPGQASAHGTLYAYQHCGFRYDLTIRDSVSGAPRTLTGKSLRLQFYSLNDPDTELFGVVTGGTAGNRLVIGGDDGNIVTVEGPATITADKRQLRWRLINVTDKRNEGSGLLEIEAGPALPA